MPVLRLRLYIPPSSTHFERISKGRDCNPNAGFRCSGRTKDGRMSRHHDLPICYHQSINAINTRYRYPSESIQWHRNRGLYKTDNICVLAFRRTIPDQANNGFFNGCFDLCQQSSHYRLRISYRLVVLWLHVSSRTISLREYCKMMSIVELYA